MNTEINLEGKTILVTGGNSGIGKKIVMTLLEKGSTVIINYNNNIDKFLEELKSFNNYEGRYTFLKADISNEGDVIKLFEAIKSKYGILDGLINNAGIDIPDKIEQLTLEKWEKVIAVNLTGKFLCTKYAIDLLKISSNPQIVNISSRFNSKPLFGASSYCCSQSGIDMLTKVSAIELSEYNIRVNTISPGLTRAPLAERYFSEEEFELKGKINPMHRIGRTDGIANLILFLFSDLNSYINGENININGGSNLI